MEILILTKIPHLVEIPILTTSDVIETVEEVVTPDLVLIHVGVVDEVAAAMVVMMKAMKAVVEDGEKMEVLNSISAMVVVTDKIL